MKKLLVTVMMVFFACYVSFANDPDLFKLDYNAVQAEFTELNQLGDMVAADENLTFSTLNVTNGNLVASLKLISESSLPFAAAEQVAGIPSFLWGCVLGPVGLAIVYIATEKDQVETKKALWGCVAGTGTYVVVWVIYYFLVINTVASAI